MFQFDPIELRLPRGERKDLHLFLCDDIYFMDRKKEQIERYQYDFALDDTTTENLARTAARLPSPQPGVQSGEIVSDHTQEEYMAKVEVCREGMKQGDYYEVVLRQTFSAPFTGSVSALFERVQQASPSPYEFLIQFGDEQLVGASPEMFVRVEGTRVETCPIAGTARRTGDPLKDAANIRDLLEFAQGRIRADHVYGRGSQRQVACLRSRIGQGDWPAADRVVRGSVPHRRSRRRNAAAGLRLARCVSRAYVGGDDCRRAEESSGASRSRIWRRRRAAGTAARLEHCRLNGDINTGILIRTIHVRDGRAEYPVGATLLYDSVPEMEERETRLKATGFFRALRAPTPGKVASAGQPANPSGGPKMLLVDNDDCFIHTLANYARQTGAEVVTYRAGFPLEMIDELRPDLILISPGPGRPADFGVPDLVRFAAEREIPVFGVCLGLQGIVEAFGGELGVLEYPMHGKPSTIKSHGVGIFEGLPERFQVGRYHSLYAIRGKFPACLEVTAETDDGVIMGVRHRELPIEAVQFHPESLLSLDSECGLRLMRNVVALYGRARAYAQR